MGLRELPKYFSEVFWEIELSQTPPTCLIIQQCYYGTQMRIAESCTKSQPCVARIELTITQPILNNQFFETQLINELSKQGWSWVFQLINKYFILLAILKSIRRNIAENLDGCEYKS